MSNLLSTELTAKALDVSISTFRTVIKHQPNFPKAVKLHPTAHPKWRDFEIEAYKNGVKL